MEKGLISHNSVTLRSVIFHAIEHSNKMSAALIDIKQVEFTKFKGMNGITAVANNVAEACEILRIGRQVMHSRNKKLQSIGLNDIADHKPTEYNGKIWITGRDFPEDAIIKCRVGNIEKEMTALEVYEYLH